MSHNANFSFEDVAIVSVEACEAPNVVTSDQVDERLAPLYERGGGRAGLLESLAGIRERRQWPSDVSFTDAAAMAGEKAIEAAGIDRSRIGVLIDSSVCRARLEPSSAVTVHDRLGLATTCLNFDLVNACLGFLNAMHVAGLMIDSGQIDYALVVDGEGTTEVYDNTINRLLAEGEVLEDVLENFATLTLGSGSAAMVLGRHSENPGSHQMLGGFFRAATEHHKLCIGSLQGMKTDTRALLDAGTELAKQAWDDAGAGETWGGRDRYILHQVSEVHTNAMLDVLGIEQDRVPKTFPHYGNIGPAAIPITLASVTDTLSPGDAVLCMGIGSGLNAGVIDVRW
ncbi:MAG: 3-oxoacyl-ACP synthase III [Actinomycetota bacterium]|jgi:acyl-CoA:acyl-CoA alkyltransferase|nr:3-oxoacyl-ACP synthase III [Actinomycetota bacterium]